MFAVNRPLSLQGAFNVRDLGGYPLQDGGVTRRGVFYRADGTHALTAEDVKTLRGLGVTLAVDLRLPVEVERQPSRLAGCTGIRYENVAMFDGIQSAFLQNGVPASLSSLYESLLEHSRKQYARVFRLFLENEGASLFHCTAGKDRTGVVAMLLLRLAGVDEGLVAADYAASEQHLRPLFEQQREQVRRMGIDAPDYIFQSPAEEMKKVLAYLQQVYGGAEEYLRCCGLSAGETTALKFRVRDAREA